MKCAQAVFYIRILFICGSFEYELPPSVSVKLKFKGNITGHINTTGTSTGRFDFDQIILECNSKYPNKWTFLSNPLADADVSRLVINKIRKAENINDKSTYRYFSELTLTFKNPTIQQMLISLTCTHASGLQERHQSISVLHPKSTLVDLRSARNSSELFTNIELMKSMVTNNTNARFGANTDCTLTLHFDGKWRKFGCSSDRIAVASANLVSRAVPCKNSDECDAIIQNDNCANSLSYSFVRILEFQLQNFQAKPILGPGAIICQYGELSVARAVFATLEDPPSYYINNNEKPQVHKVLKLRVANGSLFERELISVHCTGSASYFSKGFRMGLLFENGTLAITESSAIAESYLAEGHAYDAETTFRLNSINITQIICFAPVWNSYKWEDVSVDVTIQSFHYPKLTDELKTEKITVPEHGSVSFDCSLAETNVHPVTFAWLKVEGRFGKVLPKETHIGFVGQKNYDIQETNYSTTLKLFNVVKDSNYSCRATHNYGRAERSTYKQFVVKVLLKTANLTVSARLEYAIGIIVLVIVVTILTSYGFFRYLHRKKINLTDEEIEEFKNGKAYCAIDKLLHPMQELHYGPYNSKIEISSNEYQIDTSSVLGFGQFGIVFKGLHKHMPIAVKTINPNVRSEKANLLALLSELKVMIYVNGHKNIINLIGANTEELRSGLAYIFVELCPLGSLENFLRSHNDFVNQISHQGDIINPVTYSNVVLSSDTIFTADLVLWVFQIASGMAYLESKKVIHGDLATRNVLLLNRENIKITDFGLARQLFNSGIYQKTNRRDPLPWRWMAIESLRSFTFSSKSDVWSFGITMWEVFSLGDVPYPGLGWAPDFVEKLENNLRLTQPKYVSEDIFSEMLRCWNPEPDERPNFEFLVNYFAGYLRKFPHTKKYSLDGGCDGDDCESDSYV